MNDMGLANKLGLDKPQKLVENRVSFAGPHSELSIYDTYLPAEKVILQSSGLLYCGMIQGKKVLHGADVSTGAIESMEFIPNQSFVMAANTAVAIDFPEARIDKPTRCLTVEIDSQRIVNISERLEQQFGNPLELDSWHVLSQQHLHTAHSPGTQMLLQRLFNSFVENESERDIAIDFGVSELITRILRHQARDFILHKSLESSDKSGLHSSIHFIKTHLHEAIDIEKLCKLACMSRSRFYQSFKQKLGCTPLELQQQLRLDAAAQRLKLGESVSQVCYSLGYASLSHFNHRFQARFGMPPSHYANKNEHH
jgi:AraC-like DNA-binding protein